MRRLQRAPRIVTCCVAGGVCSSMAQNRRRLALLCHVLDQVMAEYGQDPPDALVFPGGMFRLTTRFAQLPGPYRFGLLNAQAFVTELVTRLRAYRRHTPMVIFGINAKLPAHQACLAVSGEGIVGLSVKHFFGVNDRDGKCYPTTDALDFRSMSRFVRLANGSVASLSDCYDLFGLREDPAHPGIRMRAIRRIHDRGRIVEEHDFGFSAVRTRLAKEWWETRARASPDLAIAVIHSFAAPGRDGYWQRHGIAAASAFLGGGLVVGASHFAEGLPAFNAPLAARGVPVDELTAGLHRQAHHLWPKTLREVVIDGQIVAVLRLFIGNRPKKRRTGPLRALA